MSGFPRAVIFDGGSGTCKAGFAGENVPRVVLSSVVGRPMGAGVIVGMDQRNAYVGDKLLSQRGALRLNNPVQEGVITNWDDMQELWDQAILRELRIVDPEEHFILLTEAPGNPILNRERMTQIMFESFCFQGMYTQLQQVLSLQASGRLNGCVVDSGEGLTRIVPIVDGHATMSGIDKMYVEGRHLKDYLRKILGERGYSFSTKAEAEALQNIREQLAYTALDFNLEMRKAPTALEKSLTLPDGKVITLGNERFRCAEGLFNPDLIGRPGSGVHNYTFQGIMKCDAGIRQNLFENIILAGGYTMFPGIAERLTKELTALAPPNTRINVTAPPNRKYSAWIGGSTLASLSTFQDMCISKAEYDESGPSIVYQKFPL